MPLYSREDVCLVSQSAFLDAEWYMERYKDLLFLEISPAEHYLWLGAELNRDPSPQFSTKSYLENNPDVREAEINPLLHFLKFGQGEGRSPTPDSDPLNFMRGSRNPRNGSANLLLCVHDLNVNLFGGERSFQDVLVQIDSIDVNVFVTIPKSTNAEYVDFLRRKSCGVFQFIYPQWRQGESSQGHTLARIEAIIVENKIDVVYTNTIFLRDIQYIAKKLNRKSFCHVRELINEDPDLRRKIGLETKEIIADLWERSDYLIANSRRTQEAFAGIRQPVYAPNVVDCGQFNFSNAIGDRITFAIISSNTIKKGIADFIEIAELCLELAPRADFWIIGPTNVYIEELQKQGFPPNVFFKGYFARPQDALFGVNVVMSLSHFAESFGRSVAEAQAARRPVIAYSWGAIPELVEHGITGFLVPHRAIGEAAQSVKMICDEPSLIDEMGAAGRQRMLENYTPEVLRDTLRLTFSEAVGRNIDFRSDAGDRGVTVVIPVYNGYEAVKRCLESVEAWTTPHFASVLVINDGSTDPNIAVLLSRFAGLDRFELIDNDINLGYTRTINKAIKRCAPNDVILLNSDTIVTPRWVEGLRDTVYSSDDIGTATAMGDHAGAFSFPLADESNPKPNDASHALWATTITRHTEKSEPVEVPTGSGFCIYIRRETIDEVGPFDEELFPRGYGEENDFCMRAKAAGWRNFISPKTYIFHERSVSFGKEKAELIAKATEVMADRYPSYFQDVAAAFSSTSINQLRATVASVGGDPKLDRLGSGYIIAASSPAARFVRLNEVLINWDYHIEAASGRDRETTSIIICAHNDVEQVGRCVRSIIDSVSGMNVEIIIVDNGSDANNIIALETLCEEFLDVKAIYNYENLNFALGSNIGFSASIGARVVFMNSNIQVTNNWLGPLVASLEDETVKGAQPRLLSSDGKIHCVGLIFTGRGPFGRPLYKGRPNFARYASKKHRLQAVAGACMALRATDFANIRGFDPRFINGQEDIDICLRLDFGTRAFLYVPNSIVYLGENENRQADQYMVHNKTELYMRWNDKALVDDSKYFDKDGLEELDKKMDIGMFFN